MLSLSPTLSFFIYTPSSIPSTLFTLYSPLYSTFNTPGYSRLPGYSGCRVTRVTHLPTTCRLSLSLLALLISSLSFILASIPHCLHFSLLPLLIIFHLLSFPLFCPVITSLTHHLPFPFILVFIPPQINLLFNIFSITHLLTLLNSPLYIPNYLLTSFPQLTFIYSKLLTYFISSTHLYIFQITPTSLTYLILILFSISYPTLLPLLLSPLSISLSHQNFTYPYIHNPTNSFIITKNITPKILFISFLLFFIPYFQLKLHPLLLYFIFY